MYIYLNEQGYVYGCGSEPENAAIKVEAIPDNIDICSGLYRYENGQYVFNENAEDMASGELELKELYQWFEWYDQQSIQYQRYLRLGLEFDQDMIALDTLATTNAAKIKELRQRLAE